MVKMFIGLILVAVGIFALLIKLGVLSGSLWDYTWPAILIILGLVLLFGRYSRRAWGWCRPWFFPGEGERKH
ncbi:MAG: hypothetical protein HY530_06110 [Chloroflexi bacterium]|nr:hypothetical protein [Chloroflexota bacterium]